jgi:hypothetical protein
MAREKKAFAIALFLVVGVLGVESARALHAVVPHGLPQAAHRVQLQPR